MVMLETVRVAGNGVGVGVRPPVTLMVCVYTVWFKARS
jgi:hypothetical protein